MDVSLVDIWRQLRQEEGVYSGLFEDMDEEAVVLLASLAVREDFTAESCVFREGSTGDSMYVVASGQFRVSKTDPLGSELELRILGRGEVFGEIALLDQVYRSATITAATDGVCFKLDRADLERHPALSVRIYRNLARILARRLRRSTDEVLLLETSLRLEMNDRLD